MNDKVDVLVREALTADDLALVRTMFEAVGLQPSIRVMPPRRGIDPAWLLLITFPAQTMLKVALERMGADAFQYVKRLAGGLCQRAKAPEAEPSDLLVVQCVDSPIRIVLEPDLPPDAYRILVEQVVPIVPDGEWRWDRERSRWDRHGPR